MRPFIYNALPARVVFGVGTLKQLPEEVKRLGCNRALVLSTSFQEQSGKDVQELLGSAAVGLYSNATMHTPENITLEALKMVESTKADCVVSVGGGSTIGLGKAIAYRTDLPQIVIPTTYAGSEATPILGQTAGGQKTTLKSSKVLPEVILYDVDLTLTLPATMTVTSGMNAIAHAVEALYSPEGNPMMDMLAEQGIAAIARALPIIHKDPHNKEARSDALFGAWACGTCLGAVGMSLHHKLCHTLGGSFNMPHAETHTVILPHAVVYNEPGARNAIATVARALGVKNAAQGLYDLAKNLGAPYSLKELGFKEEDIPKAAEIASKAPYPNPVKLEKDKIQHLLQNAWAGNPPN
jgi:alcohol dehydrogenase class IV